VQLRLLDDAVADRFANATERQQAMIPDRQGIGAPSSREPGPASRSHVTV